MGFPLSSSRSKSLLVQGVGVGHHGDFFFVLGERRRRFFKSQFTFENPRDSVGAGMNLVAPIHRAFRATKSTQLLVDEALVDARAQAKTE